MLRNFVNWQDLRFLIRGLRTGSVWRTFRRLMGGRADSVKATWEQVEGPPSYMWSIPAVRQRATRLITGSADVGYPAYVSEKYLAPLQPLRGLSLGCGSGQKELNWTRLCHFSQLDAYDISEARIERAREQARAAERSEIHYRAADVYGLDWPDGFYDVVFFDQSLHHFTPLEALLLKVRRTLKSRGYLIASEFIGPTRFQWTNRQLEAINGVLAILPRRYRKRWSDGGIKERVHRPSRLRMLLSDPSEAVESGRIVPLLERHFEVVERKDYGGTVIHMLFDDIAHNFLDEAGQVKDDEAQRLIELCFRIEDALLGLGELESDFAMFVCRPPSS